MSVRVPIDDCTGGVPSVLVSGHHSTTAVAISEPGDPCAIVAVAISGGGSAAIIAIAVAGGSSSIAVAIALNLAREAATGS
jgi:hypothetical protein